MMEIGLGALAPSLSEQGFGKLIEADSLKHFQKDNAAVSRLYVRGLISRSQADSAYSRLVKNISSSIQSGAQKAAK